MMEDLPFEDIRAGGVILRENTVSDRVFIIEAGEVAILRRVDGTFREMNRLGPGDFFGQLSLLEDLPTHEVARAVTDCRLLTITKDLLPYVLKENVDVALMMIRRLSILAQEQQLLALEVRPEVTPQKPGSDESSPTPPALVTPEAEAPAAETPAAETPGPAAPDPAPAAPARGKAPERAPLGPRLVHEDSEMYSLLDPEREMTLGRSVGDFEPDIDLGPIDPKSSASRLHARIAFRDGHFRLTENAEKPPLNGTFVNEERLGTGEGRSLEAGDLLRLGLVELRFRPQESAGGEP